MEPFLGQLMLVGFNFAPKGWALCNGQLLPISQNAALYSLLGNTYGGDGVTTFALPDLRGRAPIAAGQGTGLPNWALGQTGGGIAVTPDKTGGNLTNQPVLAMNWIIATSGVFPSQ
jgi:microcystin-dependent protein